MNRCKILLSLIVSTWFLTPQLKAQVDEYESESEAMSSEEIPAMDGQIVTDGLQVNSLPTVASNFVGINPCRLADTRGNGFSGAYGPPALSSGVPRDFVLVGRCGLPSNAQAVSLNFTVVQPASEGYLTTFPKGGFVPLVSTMNFRAGWTIANAALVPLGDNGAITVFSGGTGTDLVIDVNGYFVGPPAAQKLCTVINRADDGWRETIAVPASWTATLCNNYRIQTVPSDSNYQLGCLTESGISLGALDGGLPSSNCGW